MRSLLTMVALVAALGASGTTAQAPSPSASAAPATCDLSTVEPSGTFCQVIEGANLNGTTIVEVPDLSSCEECAQACADERLEVQLTGLPEDPATCNIWVFCSNPDGCDNGHGTLFPAYTCTLKFQADLNAIIKEPSLPPAAFTVDLSAVTDDSYLDWVSGICGVCPCCGWCGDDPEAAPCSDTEWCPTSETCISKEAAALEAPEECEELDLDDLLLPECEGLCANATLSAVGVPTMAGAMDGDSDLDLEDVAADAEAEVEDAADDAEEVAAEAEEEIEATASTAVDEVQDAAADAEEEVEETADEVVDAIGLR